MAGSAAHDPHHGIRARLRPDPPSIRLAEASELDQIASLFAPGLEPYRGTDDDWILDNYLEDLLKVRERFPVAETYVAVAGEVIVGSVAFYRDVALEGWSNLPTGWTGFRALVVHPAGRGFGVGRRLVERCIERTREVDATVLGIHTIALLADAIRLYERLGFVRCPEFDLRAKDVFGAPPGKDLHGPAFRYDVRNRGRPTRAAPEPREGAAGGTRT
jgi:GNAT superfamily N-acetyltransferase